MSNSVATSSALEDDVKQKLERFKFREIMEIIAMKPHPILSFDAADLGPEYFENLRNHPSETLEATRGALRSCFKDLHPVESADNPKILDELDVAIGGYDPQYTVNIEDVERFVHVEGKVSGLDEVNAIVVSRRVRCSNCGHVTVSQGMAAVKRCEACNDHAGLVEQYDSTSLRDNRFIVISLMPDKHYGIGQAEDDSSVTYLWVQLIGQLAKRTDYTYGTNLSVHGRLTVGQPLEKKVPLKNIEPLNLYLEANRLDVVDDSRLRDVDSLQVTEQDVESFHEFIAQCKSDGRVLEILSKSIAPQIIGPQVEPIKESLLIQQVAGFVWKQKRKDHQGERKKSALLRQASYDHNRKTLNIMWCSDPSEGKTTVALALTRLGGGVYAVGEGMKPAGLAGGINSDKATGRRSFEVGFAIGNRPKIFDEVDKIKTEFRQAVLGAASSILESGFFIINASGAKATLEAAGPWSAFLNPVGGNYDDGLGLVANLNLPTPFISRFDMIWFTKSDKDNRELDEQKMESVDSVMCGDELLRDGKGGTALLDPEFVAKWIKHARTIEVTADQATLQPLHTFFFRMKNRVETQMQMRQYASLVRYAFGRAAACLRSEVSPEDVQDTMDRFTQMWARLGANLSDLAEGISDKDKRGLSKKALAYQLINEVIGENEHMLIDLAGLADQMVAYGKGKSRDDALAWIMGNLVKTGELHESPPGSGQAKKAYFRLGS
jgi:DNA replicative helicase MCM subunit Mcm2 (Cdc46/Mcm family)